MCKYLKIENDNDYSKLQIPAEIITKGGIVVFPTETVYGIGVNGFDKHAIKKLYDIKKRPLDKPISLLVNSFEMIEKIAKDITKLEYALMKKFFPGPFTIILKKKSIVPDILTANGDTVGIRMPSGKIAQKLIEFANVPLATPSANISGQPAGTDFEYIQKSFGDKVDFYIDNENNNNQIGIASTIVKVVDEQPHILRVGSISEDEIFNVKKE